MKRAHLIKTNRRAITIQEWASFLGISRAKVSKLLEEYRKVGGTYDPRDQYSILIFHRFLLKSPPFFEKLLKEKYQD